MVLNTFTLHKSSQVKSSQVAFNKNVTSAHLYKENVMNKNTNNTNK